MSGDGDLGRLEAELAEAEAEAARLKEEHAAIGERNRAEPSAEGRAERRVVAAALEAARERVAAARVALDLFRRTGSPYGLVTEKEEVMGAVAVAIPKGVSSAERARLIAAALADQLTEAAQGLGVVLAAPPERYTRERPGRDAERRTVLDVAGRVEGDTLVPVSRTSKGTRG
jgi:hypothetical protein